MAEPTTPATTDAIQLVDKDYLIQVCSAVAKELGAAILTDMRHIVKDIRQQYKDHNLLLAKQELIVQDLLGHVNRLSAAQPRRLMGATNGSSKKGGNGWRIRPDLCAGETTASDDYLMEAGSPHRQVAHVHDEFSESGTGSGRLARKPEPRMCSAAPPHPHPHPHPSPEPTLGSITEDPVLKDALPGESNSPMARLSGDDDDPMLKCEQIDVNAEYQHPGKEVDQLITVDNSCMPGERQTSDGSDNLANHASASSGDLGTDPAKGGRVTHSGTNMYSMRGSMVERHGNMFTQMDDMRHGGQANMMEEDYNVMAFYTDKGICQMVARSDVFANITLAVIAANAIYIGVDADNNDSETLAGADIGFQISEHIFCTFFTFEWLMRFGAFKHKKDCCKDMWFRFDTALVLMMVVETWIVPLAFAGSGGTGVPTGLVKMLRLLRLFRMARLMRAFPELVAMVKGVKVASRAVGSALLMLLMLVYIYAIIMHTILKDYSYNYLVHERFRRIGLCMWTLLIDGTFLDGIGLVTRALLDISAYAPLIVLLTFILCSALTVMNMLIGVLCEVVSAVAAAEKEDSAIRIVKDRLLVMLKEMDEDGSGLIDRDEMQQVIENQNALKTLGSLHVDVQHLMDQLDMLFEDTGELTIHAIMDLILMLRGDRTPTMTDLLDCQAFFRWKIGQQMDGNRDHISDHINKSIGMNGHIHSLTHDQDGKRKEASGSEHDQAVAVAAQLAPLIDMDKIGQQLQYGHNGD